MHERTKPATLSLKADGRACDFVERPRLSFMQSVRDFLDDMVQSNNIELFPAMPKPAHIGECHQLDAEHLRRSE